MNKHIISTLLFWGISLYGMAQNTSNISGSFDIGPVGNATYNIPVDLPPGTAGLKPDISIVYNSFPEMGLWEKVFPFRLSLPSQGLMRLYFIVDISAM